MRLSKQLFTSEMRKPFDYDQRKTSSLLEDGVFAYFRDPGIPFYLPIGRKVLTNLERIFLEEARELGMSHIEIPEIMRDEVLEEGKEIINTFNERIVRLNSDSLEGYHLLTTPEPMILDLASVSLSSHNQLPIRFVYNVDVVRGVPRPRGILKGRQFKTFMGNSLDKDSVSLGESLELFGELSENIFTRFGIKTYKRKNQGGIDIEYFYFGPEGDNLLMPEIDLKNRVKAMSLSMAYHYDPGKKVKARFKNKQNKNSRTLYGTFGLGTQRVFYALFDSHRDSRGFNLPLELVPFQFSVIPINSDDYEKVEGLYEKIKGKTLLDDRKNVLFGEKATFSDYIGIPWKIIYGKGYYTLKSRDEQVINVFNSTEELGEYLKGELK